MNGDNPNGEMVVYVGDDGKPQIQARLQDKNMWLTQSFGGPDTEIRRDI
jgi:hypothetical protein